MSGENYKSGPETPMLSPEKGYKGLPASLNLLSGDKRGAPEDRYRAVYLIFYLLGLGTLLPWNFFITAQGYWMYKFRHLNLNETISHLDPMHRSDLQRNFTSYLSVCSMIPNTIFLMLNTILSRRPHYRKKSHKIVTVIPYDATPYALLFCPNVILHFKSNAKEKLIPIKIRLIGSLVVVIVLFSITTVLVKTDTDEWQETFFMLTLLTVIVLNCMTAIFQGALFGVGGTFPSQITQAIMNGQALGGVFASVASIVFILIGGSDVDSAFSYFLAAVATLIISIIAYLSLTKFEFYNYYISVQSGAGTELSSAGGGGQRSKSVPFLYILKKIKVYAISVCLVFTVTLSVFPAVTVLVVSHNSEDGDDWNKKFFIPVGCFLIYNLGDYMGRMAAGWHDLPKTKIPLLPILCILRVSFIPLLMFCNAQPRELTGVAFNNDAYFLFFMIVFSLSGGYLASQAMIHGPKEADPEHQEPAGAMMAFFLGFGLMLGAAFSNIFVRLL